MNVQCWILSRGVIREGVKVMEVMTRKKQDYHFTRKLTDEEIEQLIGDYDYDMKYLDPDYVDENDDGALWDKFGNPTESMIRAKYEERNGIGRDESMTLGEFRAWLDEMIPE